MAAQSYLPDTSGGIVVAAAFGDDDAARDAVDSLYASGVRWQDISVIAQERERAELVAGDRAWTPWRARRGGPLELLRAAVQPDRLPREIRRRYGGALAAGSVLVVAAAGGQPPDTLEALLTQARGAQVAAWWTRPVDIFPPPELAGPF